MRRWLLALLLVPASQLLLMAEPDAPPPVRGDRSRLRQTEWVVPVNLQNSDDAARAAAADLLTLVKSKFGDTAVAVEQKAKFLAEYGPEFRHLRYLSLHSYPSAMRQDVIKDVNYLLNCLSHNDEIVTAAVGGPDNLLVRVNLRDYDIDPKDWDELGLTDPYYHKDLEQVTETPKSVTKYREVGTGRYRQEYPGGPLTEIKEKQAYKENVAASVKKEKTRALSGANPESLLNLTYYTQSKAPILRADWWIVNASTSPGYYKLLRLKNIKDVKELAGFDARAQDRKEVKATVVTSGSYGLTTPVARNNRILARTPTFQGYYWETFDFKNNLKARNVINNFLNIKENEEGNFEVGKLSGLNAKDWLKEIRKEKLGFRDAGELIFSLPNGIQGYALTNDKDELIDEAAIEVAVDSTSRDFRVINARSCIWCHSDGIRPFKSHFQLQVGQRQLTDLGIALKDKEKALELQEFIRRTYGSPNFEEVVDTDRQLYVKAVARANGLSIEKNATLFRSLWNSYAEDQLDTNRICYELGIQPEQIKELFALRKDGVNSGVLLQQLLQPPINIRREHWEEVFDTAYQLTLALPKK